jgi:predicted dehydrogenase/sugar phosphate isomerase/epimerase
LIIQTNNFTKYMKFQFGLSTVSFKNKSLSDALDHLKLLDFRWIDLVIVLPDFCPHYDPLKYSFEEDYRIAEMFKKNGFSISSINVVPGFFNHGNPENTMHFLERTMILADVLGAKIITIPSGAKKSEFEWETSVLRARPHFHKLVKLAKDKGISISVEAPHIGTLVETPVQAKRFFDLIGNNDLKCTFDTSHVRIGENFHLKEAINIIGFERINHIHLRDAFKNSINLTPGKGTCDYKDFLYTLIISNYDGFLTYELEFHDLTDSQVLEEIKFAKSYIDGILEDKEQKGLKFNPYYHSLKRFMSKPKTELKRYPGIFKPLQSLYLSAWPFFPKKLYLGNYKRKRFSTKPQIDSFKKESFNIHNPYKRKISIGIVGLGAVGLKWHAEGFNRLKNVNLVGGFDISNERSKLFDRKYRTLTCQNIEDLILRKPDILVISTREWDHYPIAKLALESNIDIFCEKLFTAKIEHARELINLADQRKKVIGVNYNYRYMPGIVKLAEIIRNNTLGKLKMFSVNIAAQSYAHGLDLMHFLGGDIVELSGKVRNDPYKRNRIFDWFLFDEDIQYIPTDATSVTFEFSNGVVGNLNSSIHYDLNKFILSVEAVFEKSVVTLNGINMFNPIGVMTYSSDKNFKGLDLSLNKGLYAKGFGYTFYESIRDFVECYINNKPVPVSGQIGLFNMYLEKLIHESSESRTKILLEKRFRN